MRIALISPRYGAEITRGAERACWLLAEELCERHSVEVLTTCARDEETWKNDYAEGIDRVRGVVVRRFPVSGGRDPAFHSITQRLATSAHSRADELDWLKRSGTTSAALVEFLKRHQRNYDALIFFSYKAGTTIQGLTVAPERSVLFPCATLEPALRFLIASDALAAPAGVGYVSAAEKRLVRAHFSTRPRGEEIVSVGVAAMHEARYPRLIEEPADPEEADEDAATVEAIADSTPAHLSGRGVLFRRQHRLHGRFGIYAGVVESNNGVEELLEYFDRYASRDSDLALVVMGVKMMKLPSEPWLRSGAVLAERDRLAALEAADVAFAPDPDDILGEQALEAFAAGTPVLASARNAAAVEHIRRGGAGLYYANGDEFVESLRLIMTNDRLRNSLGRAGRRYVLQHHRWDAVISRLERLLSNLKKAA